MDSIAHLNSELSIARDLLIVIHLALPIKCHAATPYPPAQVFQDAKNKYYAPNDGSNNEFLTDRSAEGS